MLQGHPNSAHSRDVRYMLHPNTNARAHERVGPVIMERGDGIYVYDDQGKAYIEGLAGLWSVAVGFGEKRLAEAARKQCEKLPYYHTFSHKANEPAIDLAEYLVSVTPPHLEKVMFTNSGSEANDTVIKLIWYYNNARGRPKKKKLISRNNAYHGVTIASGSLTGLAPIQRDFDLPFLPVHYLTCPNHYRFAEPGESEAAFADRLAAEFEALIEREGADTIAAFFAEPVMAAGGVIPPPETYWDKMQAVCRRHDILLVVDEVVCGFGRLGRRFACEHYGIVPDILVLSKQITSSYMPLAAFLMSGAFYNTIADNSEKIGILGHGYTTTGHPVAAAVALENLRIIDEENLVENAAASGKVLQEELNKLRSHPLVGNVRGVGLIAGVELVADKDTRRPFSPVGKVGAEVFAASHRHGLIIRPLGDTTAFCPPLIITEDETREMVSRFRKTLDDVRIWIDQNPDLTAG